MDKTKVNQVDQLLSQIVTAANGVSVAGEQNMAQLLGICRAARQVHQLVHTPAQEEVDEHGG